jgi:hypothetical protein
MKEYKRLIDINTELIDKLHDQKIYVQCKTYELNNQSLINYLNDTVHDERFIFIITMLRNKLIEEIIVAQEDKLEKLRGQLQGVCLFEMITRQIINNSIVNKTVKEQLATE